ncbi:MAG: signal peptidase II [Candidatus Izimaplasma sp.]|nr:signal peptidase II [Candidatus Izimaplasma bacterium]
MKKTLTVGLIVIFSSLLLDQLTKYIVKTQMTLGDEIVVIPNFFTLSSHRNDGAAWGLFSGNMLFFYAVTTVAGILFYLLLKDADVTHKKLYSYGVFLMVAGGFGNFIDRLLFQEVIDFIDIDIFSYTTYPIFNIADICLVVGMIMFTLDVLLEEFYYGKNSRQEKRKQ